MSTDMYVINKDQDLMSSIDRQWRDKDELEFVGRWQESPTLVQVVKPTSKPAKEWQSSAIPHRSIAGLLVGAIGMTFSLFGFYALSQGWWKTDWTFFAGVGAGSLGLLAASILQARGK